MCVCVCVCMRERERERGGGERGENLPNALIQYKSSAILSNKLQRNCSAKLKEISDV